MFLSQKKAKLLIRKNAGYSVASAEEAVASLPKKVDGKRLKVKMADVQKIIDEANCPSPPPPVKSGVTIRPFRKSLVNQIRRAHGLPEI